MTLAERCAEISKQLGYAEGTPLAMVVSQAETDLGLGGKGLDLVQRCNRVCETLGIEQEMLCGYRWFIL